MNQLEEGNEITIQFNKREGIVPVIVQEESTKTILMLGYTNEEAFKKTIEEKTVCFYSTSKKALWTKGATSGNYLALQKVLVDCDQDALVYLVKRISGGVCHTVNKYNQNRLSCFYRSINTEHKIFEFIEK
jgi:phosphoribosyl-AMP cyclohydrolase